MFGFLPLFLAAYFLLPTRGARNLCLLAASLLFYAWGEPVYVLLMVVSIVVNWALTNRLGRRPAHSRVDYRRKTLILGVVFNVLVIGFFKYESFVAQTINDLLGAAIVPDLELPLPIGISFYTLQALSYLIDVYRGDALPQRNMLWFGMYVSCFPQLVAGPIVRYQDIFEQVTTRKETLDRFANGVRLFVIGLAQKALLANVIALCAQQMLQKTGPNIGLIGSWAGLIAYTFQIYFDFAGYSFMAIGLGRMLGFSYLRNFNYPYISKSITEFWRRWHISLSTFFRDYVYIPLGGSRCSTARWVLNLSAVWLLTGLWHGAAWNYVLWGAYYGALLVGEKLLWGKALEHLPGVLRHLYTIVIFVCGWSFFWITDTAQLTLYWRALTGGFGLTGSSTLWELTCWEYLPVYVVCLLASMPVVPFAKYLVMRWAQAGRNATLAAPTAESAAPTAEPAAPTGDPAAPTAEPAATGEPNVALSAGFVTRSLLADFAQASIVNPKHIRSEGLCEFDLSAIKSPRRAACAACAAIALLSDVLLLALFVASCMQVVSGSFNPFIYFQF